MSRLKADGGVVRTFLALPRKVPKERKRGKDFLKAVLSPAPLSSYTWWIGFSFSTAVSFYSVVALPLSTISALCAAAAEGWVLFRAAHSRPYIHARTPFSYVGADIIRPQAGLDTACRGQGARNDGTDNPSFAQQDAPCFPILGGEFLKRGRLCKKPPLESASFRPFLSDKEKDR